MLIYVKPRKVAAAALEGSALLDRSGITLRTKCKQGDFIIGFAPQNPIAVSFKFNLDHTPGFYVDRIYRVVCYEGEV